MTIQLLQTWNGNPAGIYTWDGAEESRLIAAGLARAYVESIDGASGRGGSVVPISAAIFAAPTAQMLADTRTFYELATTKALYRSNGSALALVGDGTNDIANLPQFGAVRALTDWKKYSVTADALVINGPCIVKGFRCLTGTSIVGVYDALSATGTNLMPGVTTAANTEYLLAGEGGVLFSTGLYVDWGSGTYVFYALPVEF